MARLFGNCVKYVHTVLNTSMRPCAGLFDAVINLDINFDALNFSI